MSLDIRKLLEQQRKLISEEKKRLGIITTENNQENLEIKSSNNDFNGNMFIDQEENQYADEINEISDYSQPNNEVNFNKHVESENENQNNCKKNERTSESGGKGKENGLIPPHSKSSENDGSRIQKNVPLIERLDLSFTEGTVEQEKQLFIDKLVNCENPFTFRSDDRPKSAMFRYGEYSPNNPNLRTPAVPYLGLGEYEQRRQYIRQQRKEDYREHLTKRSSYLKSIEESISNNSKVISPGLSKSVQTDIQNIHNKLVQYELHSHNPPEKELSSQAVASDKENHIMHSNRSSLLNRFDQKLSTGNSLSYSSGMDKPRSILTNRLTDSPRDRLMQDLKHSYVPSFMDGFSYQDKTVELQRERLKCELYQQELKMQIEEKKRLAFMRDEQERREQELENRRLEQQLMRMQEEQVRDEQRRNRRDDQMRRNSEEFIRRKQEMQSRLGYRKHTESESSVSSLRNTNVASKQLSHYSPPVSRRNPYSFNIPSTSVFSEPTSSRYDSLSRIDTLNRQDALNRLETLNIKDSLSRVQRRHSATQQDLSMTRRSPKPQRRNSSSRFDDTLPIPVLKAHSPVAKELKNSVAVSSSRHSSDAVRRLEDKWQIPAVQKNIVNHGDLLHEGHGRNILTQLGAIRMQLQQEQLRMDETLRKRGISQSKAVDFH